MMTSNRQLIHAVARHHHARQLRAAVRAVAWYDAANRRLDDLTSDGYERRAAIAARYSRLASR